MIKIPDGVDAVAFYGSSVRGDGDQFSDRDVLIIGDDEIALSHLKDSMTRAGFSCACYSWTKLGFLRDRKALFIQHLRQESQILVDKNEKLRSFLSSYSPASSYSNEIEIARHLVSLTDRFPDTQYGIGWALDVLSVAFRNLAILTLANEGKYVFSFSALLTELGKLKSIGSDSAKPLLSLRKNKAYFRNRTYHLLPPKESVFQLRQIVSNVFQTDARSSAVSEASFHEHCLNSNLALSSTHWYLKARLCEGAFLTLKRDAVQLDEETRSRLLSVESAIRNPGCYSALFSNSAENLRLEVADLSQQFQLNAA